MLILILKFISVNKENLNETELDDLIDLTNSVLESTVDSTLVNKQDLKTYLLIL